MHTEPIENESYGIVIDAGSSGSRIHIYKWQNSIATQNNDELLHSVPQIIQEDGWTFKTTPGLSTYENNPEEAFTKHIKPLIEFAQKIIPKEKIMSTPVFIQATAGMRLLPLPKQEKIMGDLCKGLKQSTNFLVENCDTQIQVIDGETEGLYGWLGLNYLTGHFNNYDTSSEEYFTLGFMDMGGASTQIAFAPSDKEQVKKHRDDISTIYLKSLNGDVQKWDVFVSTWLGFGANQARKRYFAQLVNSLPENTNDYDEDDHSTKKLTDPCMPKGSDSKFEFQKDKFTVVGSGNYEQCIKMIYPLLLNNLPCEDDPCLFNGVHAPQIDYYKDKFIGISEYWYTANDVFKLGGEYGFQEFSSSVKEFCNSDWDLIKKNSKKGMYNSISDEYLIDSCFKANWVLNVLHEGFGLPRIDIEEPIEELTVSNYRLFQSADKINNRELSWTLGKILLYASGSILAGNGDIKVGVAPSSNDESRLGKKFISGGLSHVTNTHNTMPSFLHLLFALFGILCCIWSILSRYKVMHNNSINTNIHNIIDTLNRKLRRLTEYNTLNDRFSKLEEGDIHSPTEYFKSRTSDDLKIRSKSMLNISNGPESHEVNHIYRPHSKGVSPVLSASRNNTQLHQEGGKLKPIFSLADFSKYKDGRAND